jgi:hypothetical protein
VKPFEIMELVGRRSDKHFAQRRCEVGGVGRKDVGWGEVEGEDEDEV